MNIFSHALCFILQVLFVKVLLTSSCTNLIVTPGASSDGSILLAYNADDSEMMGTLYHYPARTANVSGVMREIYSWDTGAYLGEIPEAKVTYNVVGNCNEYGLCIGETTWADEFGEEVKGAILDYGSLIYVTLQRVKTSRKAIHTIVDLLETFGYASQAGETFSIADRITGEAWLMEFVGRGDEKKGVVYVARKIPDGMVAAHANLPRITTIPRNDPDNCIYSEDVVDLAREWGLYDGTDEDFSFSDTFNPLTPKMARFGDARVWALYSALSSDEAFEESYLDYAMGRNLSKRMPLWIKPKMNVSLDDVRELMANHYEDTALDSRKDVASGIFEAPYRPRPLSWYYKGQPYVNERTVATATTGWNLIAQIRLFMPVELSTVLWFGVDDSSTSPRFPVYSSSTRLSSAYYGKGEQDGVLQPVMSLDMTKAFWVQNMVSNFVYFRYKDAYPVLKKELDSVHKDFSNKLRQMDEEALLLYNNGTVDDAIEKVTEFGVNAGDSLHEHWIQFYGVLFVQFRDFVTMKHHDKNSGCGCKASTAGYDEIWKERIVRDSGDHFKIFLEPVAVEEGNSVNRQHGIKTLFLLLQGCVCIFLVGYVYIGSLHFAGRRKYLTAAELPIVPNSVTPVMNGNSQATGKWLHEKKQLALFDYGSLLSPRSTIITHNT
jgi:dipeptidase